MRSQLVLLSIVSLAIAGCGKDVERSAKPVTQSQQNGSPIDAAGPVETRAGMCQDPIPAAVKDLKAVERFSDVSAMAGAYKLTSFDAVGTSTAEAGEGIPGASGISVAKGIVAEDGSLKYEEKCRDLNEMPTSQFEWTGVAAGSIDAKSGAIAQDARFIQTVFGPGVTDQNGPRVPVDSLVWEAAQDCGKSAQSLLGAKDCGATLYQIDSNTIAVLRTTKKIDANGATIQTKILATYSLSAGGEAPTTEKPVKTPPKKKHVPVKKPVTKGNPGQGNPGQGNPGQGNPTKVVVKVQPTTSGNPGQGNPGQGNPGQGNPTKVVVVPVKPVQPVVVTAPVTSSKTKIHVKEITVKNTVAGDAVTKTKIDAKSKTNVETGVSKQKVDAKIKEVTPESTTKVKLDEKVKTNSETGVSKEKTDLKIKESSADGSSKMKVKIKIKKKGF
ncbi:MAG: pentapeptide repeat-containing protein [Bdellovibrionales bacterium]|nr:pentapeptide repeat-containing protein [Bdellovibrionales bacterium]